MIWNRGPTQHLYLRLAANASSGYVRPVTQCQAARFCGFTPCERNNCRLSFCDTLFFLELVFLKHPLDALFQGPQEQ